jgi:gliding motility-associated-like protein
MGNANLYTLIRLKSNPFVFSFLFLFGVIGLNATAQTLDYYYTFQSTDNWTEINNDVVLFSGNFNDEVSASLNIVPFTMGVQGFVNFFVSTNGFITLGQAPAANDYDPLSQGIGAPVIAPFAANLEGIDATSKISYSNDFSGFRIQWKNVRRVGYPGESFSFQIKLINNAITGFGFGAISFLYGPFQGVVGPASQVQVGIRVGTGTGISTFSNRSVLAGQPWAPDQSGAASNASCTFPSTSGAGGVPALGMLHQWFLFTAPYIDNPDVSPNCNTQGNVVIYSNYDGGILTINCDENIPNLKIGICTYEPIQVSLTGPFVGNVTQVLYAGFNSVQGNNNCGLGDFPTSITGVNPGIVQILTAPSVGDYDPYHSNGHGGWGNINSGAGLMVGVSGQCDTLYPAGGGNTPDEVVYYFMTELGGSLQFHYTQYSCWLNETLDISDGGNCCINPLTPSWDIVVSNDVTVCSGENVSLELLTNSNGSGPFQYEWTYDGVSVGGQQSLVYQPNTDGEACLTVTNALGQTLSECINVVVNEPADLNVVIPDTSGCLSEGFVVLNNVDPSLISLQRWYVNGDLVGTSPSLAFTPTLAGNYDITLEVEAVNGCLSDTTVLDAIQVFAAPIAGYTTDPLILESDNPSFTLTDMSSGNIVDWQWMVTSLDEVLTSNDSNPQFNLPWGVAGVYPISLMVEGDNGCTDVVQGEIVVNEVFSLFVPTAFTPNGDGKNDAFQLVGTGIEKNGFEMEVYNRWGQMVFYSDEPDLIWTGSFMDGAYFVPDGVYNYVIRLSVDQKAETKEYRGVIHIYR